MMTRLKILFICVGNSCRSPMAEAIARSLGSERVEAFSAGLSPLGWISDQTLGTLRTLGHDVGGLSSKGLEDVALENLDIVVSLLGARGLDAIPRTIGARREAWSIVDPFGEDDEQYLAVARELESRIRKLLAEEEMAELFFP
jgi:arsenate reductase